jgi:hypothetical protein
MSIPSPSAVKNFLIMAHNIAQANGVLAKFEPYAIGNGILITWLERRRDARVDMDTFLRDLTNAADQYDMAIQLFLAKNDPQTKLSFERSDFNTIDDSTHLQMERNPRTRVDQLELQFAESAPPGAKAERFIKKAKKDFKKRYGKKWKERLYATAWKQFGESGTFKDYFSLIENIERD